jgi:hypothetical protein
MAVQTTQTVLCAEPVILIDLQVKDRIQRFWNRLKASACCYRGSHDLRKLDYRMQGTWRVGHWVHQWYNRSPLASRLCQFYQLRSVRHC